MADNADVSVKFGADVGGIEQGSEAAAAAVSDFGAQVAEITAAINAQTAEMTSLITGMAKQLAGAMEVAAEATAHEEEEMQSLIGTMREGAAQVAELKESFMGAGEAILSFFAVEAVADWVKEMAEASEHAEQLGQRLGMSAADVQAWQADPPSFRWTPMLAFRSWRGVSDERYPSGVSGGLQAGGC